MFSIPPKPPLNLQDIEKLKKASSQIKEGIEQAAETADDIVKKAVTTIENSDNPQAKKIAEFIKAHENAAEYLKENLKSGMNYAADKAYKKADEVGTEIAKKVVKEKVKNKFFDNKFFKTVFAFIERIKKAISLPKKF